MQFSVRMLSITAPTSIIQISSLFSSNIMLLFCCTLPTKQYCVSLLTVVTLSNGSCACMQAELATEWNWRQKQFKRVLQIWNGYCTRKQYEHYWIDCRPLKICKPAICTQVKMIKPQSLINPSVAIIHGNFLSWLQTDATLISGFNAKLTQFFHRLDALPVA